MKYHLITMRKHLIIMKNYLKTMMQRMKVTPMKPPKICLVMIATRAFPQSGTWRFMKEFILAKNLCLAIYAANHLLIHLHYQSTKGETIWWVFPQFSHYSWVIAYFLHTVFVPTLYSGPPTLNKSRLPLLVDISIQFKINKVREIVIRISYSTRTCMDDKY